ncbi:MAG: HNH endonuclease [Actinobacteria bacterium]|nr:HNH endonuclease [Actinomycetota bacterium]
MDLTVLAKEARAALADATSAAPGADDLDLMGGLEGLLLAVDRAMAGVIVALTRAIDEATLDMIEALPVDGYLELIGRLTGRDARFLRRAVAILAELPATRAGLAEGWLSWGQVRAIVCAAQRVRRAQRPQLDQAVRQWGPGLAGAAPDELLGRVDEQVELLRADLAEARQQRLAEQAFVHVKPRQDHLDRGSLYGEYDDLGLSTVTRALDAAADGVSGDSPTLAQRRAQGLLRLCEAYLAGLVPDRADTHDADCRDELRGRPSDGFDRPIRRTALPRAQVVVPIEWLLDGPDGSAAAKLLTNWYGGPVPITRLVAETLACDATIEPVIVDRGRPVAIGDHTVPVRDLHRRALAAVDGGCRFPGCAAPVAFTDAHHVTHREHRGPTGTDNLVLLCRRHHTLVHQRGWNLDLNSATRELTITRGRRSWTSHPHTLPLPA